MSSNSHKKDFQQFTVRCEKFSAIRTQMYVGGSSGRVPTFLTSAQDILSLYDDPPDYT